MAYTPERLSVARRLFQRHEAPSTRKEDQFPFRKQYSFRERTLSSLKTHSSTWIDDDETDDYDPKQESASSRRKRPSHSSNIAPKKRAKIADTLIVAMSLGSDSGKGFLSSISDWGDDSTDLLEQPEGVDTFFKAHGEPRTLTTSLAHPVNFAHDPPDDGSSPCHWCANFIYGLLGLGKRTVQVMDYGNGKYEEISGEHTVAGHEPSRMCVACALERIHITQCAGHRIIPLKGYSPDTFDFGAAFKSLTPGIEGPSMINPWCSLCPSPAFFGCSAIQPVNVYQECVDPCSPDAVGCGLLLCERCEAGMRECGGEFSKVVKRNQQEDADFGSRADVEYILPGNALYRFYTG
ncbi:hypothetical protein P168DRAFT_274348 [Aspergillus campestris IBT 28561]|uniref:C6 finger domain protein n=1 Tax=Aspergillus campestris (strain IBT 28561) TaxID=1392248 RepID=A0A2I1CVT3_ASPC2|nr:uncharacterized protein P168DRAFT_274348 [Aspergillus campestris IBT 28561]PKY01732.1 hypothetical protein P168DRAFT_274348 [Aspergillus campestris IBT 28561]